MKNCPIMIAVRTRFRLISKYIRSTGGRYVVFNSFADNLLETPLTGSGNRVYLRDLVQEQTYLVSVSDAGAIGPGSNADVAAADGKIKVTFQTSFAFDTVKDTVANSGDIYVKTFNALTDHAALGFAAGAEGVSYSEDGDVVASFAAGPGFAAPPDLGDNPLVFALLGDPAAQAHFSADKGLGMRSPGENPGITGQTFRRQEALAVSIEDDAPFNFAFDARLVLGQVVTPGNRGEVSLVATLDGDLVYEETITVRNGDNRVVRPRCGPRRAFRGVDDPGGGRQRDPVFGKVGRIRSRARMGVVDWRARRISPASPPTTSEPKGRLGAPGSSPPMPVNAIRKPAVWTLGTRAQTTAADGVNMAAGRSPRVNGP